MGATGEMAMAIIFTLPSLTNKLRVYRFFASEILQPINRPWCNNKPSVEMEAHYYAFEGPELVVELCEENTGFCLHLLYEENLIINGKVQESLQPSISRYEGDKFLDKYYSYFGKLRSYTRQDQ